MERSSIYYCDPMRSGQKGGVENAHTMLRMVLPKGTSFEFLTQWDVNLIVPSFFPRSFLLAPMHWPTMVVAATPIPKPGI